jgi:hypothetical protein
MADDLLYSPLISQLYDPLIIASQTQATEIKHLSSPNKQRLIHAPECCLLPGMDSIEVEHTASRIERVFTRADHGELPDVARLEHPHVPALPSVSPPHSLL